MSKPTREKVLVTLEYTLEYDQPALRPLAVQSVKPHQDSSTFTTGGFHSVKAGKVISVEEARND